MALCIVSVANRRFRPKSRIRKSKNANQEIGVPGQEPQYYPRSMLRRYPLFVKREIRKSGKKWKHIYEDCRSIAGFGAPKWLKLEQHDAQESAEKRQARLDKSQLTSSLARGIIAALHHSNS